MHSRQNIVCMKPQGAPSFDRTRRLDDEGCLGIEKAFWQGAILPLNHECSHLHSPRIELGSAPYNAVESEGIDPPTSRMLSERSTM
jgi:hypothetical protein